MFADTRRIAPKPSRRQLAAIDRQVEALYYQIGSGVQVSILDIGTIMNAGRDVLLKGGTIDDARAALQDVIAVVRKN